MNPNDLIPTPCHEDWNAMTGNQQRKFCGKCSTHVHDLTDYSEEEILALKVQNGGKLCGAFRLAKPLTIGAGIASLALASCQKDSARTLPTVGIICPPAQNTDAESTKQIEVLRGRVSILHSNKTSSENPTKVDSSISPQPIEKQAIPHEFLILGEIAQPKVKQPKLLMGDICIPEK